MGIPRRATSAGILFFGALAIGAAVTARAATEIQQLLPPTSTQNDRFGAAVAASGDVLVIGQPGARRAQVFRWDGTSYVHEQELGQLGNSFGQAVAVDDDVIAVSAPLYIPHTVPGAAFVYRWNGAIWAHEQTLPGSVPNGGGEPGFETVLDVDGDILIFSPRDPPVTYVFRWSGTSWIQTQVIELPGGSGSGNHPTALSLSGDSILAVRAGSAGVAGAFVYRDDGSSFTLEAELQPPAGSFEDLTNPGAGIAGDVAVVGRHVEDSLAGAAHVFRRTGSTWSYEQKLTALSGDLFGSRMAIAGDSILGVALAGDGVEINSGAAYWFRRIAGAWQRQPPLFASDGRQGDGLLGVALAGDVAIVGSPYRVRGSLSLYDFGKAFVFDVSVCGNGVVGPSEACDDANTTAGDGCSATCQFEPCNNGLDDDGDGLADFPADPGCSNAGGIENPKCQNGLDDDGDGTVDFDGGAAINGGTPIADADPQCTVAWKTKEAAPACGSGAELILLAAIARRMRLRTRKPRTWSPPAP